MDLFGSLQDLVPKEYIDYVQQAAEGVQQAAEGPRICRVCLRVPHGHSGTSDAAALRLTYHIN